MTKYGKAKRNLKKNRVSPPSNPVQISLNDSKNVISPFAENNQKVISGDFAEFLENAVKDVPIKEDLTLEITTKKYDHETISTAIKNYYYNEFVESERRLKNNLWFALITLFIGLCTLTISLVLTFKEILVVVQGAISIFSWVFVWEAFDLLCFRRPELRHQQHRQINFINAKIIIKEP